MKFQDDISNMNMYIRTYIQTSRNQYVPYFFKVGGIITCDAWYKLAIACTSRHNTFEMDHSKHYHSLEIFPSDETWRVEKTTTDCSARLNYINYANRPMD